VSDTRASLPPPADLTVRVATSLSGVPAAAWDACANPGLAVAGAEPLYRADRFNPFVAHAFLSSLEDAKTVGGRSGWGPAHVLVEDAAGTLLSAAPTYVKVHSQGEYVFDYGWADAFERAGGQYYPKLQVCVPFTPVTGPRLLVRPGPRAAEARGLLVAGLKALRREIGASSIHFTFLAEAEARDLEPRGYLLRNDQQFHWFNEGYGTFDDFLAALASRKRKAIRRERRDALASGITIERLSGAAITQEHWDAFFAFYMDTGSRKWGRPYLNRRFFALVGERMAERILLVMAKREGRYVAGAINFIGDDALYGRNWGCIEDHPFLHFEVCYYQAIEEAIMRGLTRVEAGAQGEHKLARGYRPVTTWSAHDLEDPALRRAVADYLARERRQVAAIGAELAEHAPFRKAASGDEE
jgi:predicted N-acyltransferase